MSIDLSLLSPRAVTPALTAKLRSLAHDLDRIAIAVAPTAAELAKAPLLVDWRIVLSLSGLALTGFAAYRFPHRFGFAGRIERQDRLQIQNTRHQAAES